MYSGANSNMPSVIGIRLRFEHLENRLEHLLLEQLLGSLCQQKNPPLSISETLAYKAHETVHKYSNVN